MYNDFLTSPWGEIEVMASPKGITAVRFVEERQADDNPSALTARAKAELSNYFAGTLTRFSLPLDVQGTAFQQQVWQALRAIPYAQTRSYLDIAQAIGNPKAVRAVGLANGKNPIAIVVPCHRVIGKNGKLTGYAGGLTRKAALLELEKTEGSCR